MVVHIYLLGGNKFAESGAKTSLTVMLSLMDTGVPLVAALVFFLGGALALILLILFQ